MAVSGLKLGTVMLQCTALQRQQVLVFVVGWLAYASTYCLRKPLGVVKTDMQSELGFSVQKLGWLDVGLLLPYSVMQMILGPIGDKFGSRKTFGICLLLSGISMVAFGHFDNFYIFFLLLFINGTAQAQCWPNAMKSIGSWYPDNVRNSVFGMFGTCAFAGGVIGTTLAVWLQTTYGWRSAFLTPSVAVGVMGILVLMFFHQPDEIGIEIPGKDQTSCSSSKGKKTDLTLFQLCRLPMLAEVAIAVFCLKAVRYCMYMWLPMYLLNELMYSKGQAGMFSTTFEIGGVVGSALIGIVIDRFFQGRSLFGSALSAALSGVSLVLFMATDNWGIAFNSLFLFLAGSFNCGPDSILGGSVPAEIGDMDGRNAAAATVGLVNGFGSVGTFLEGPIIGLISSAYGFTGMFYFMILFTFIGSLSVFRASSIKSRQVHRIPEAVPLEEPV